MEKMIIIANKENVEKICHVLQVNLFKPKIVNQTNIVLSFYGYQQDLAESLIKKYDVKYTFENDDTLIERYK